MSFFRETFLLSVILSMVLASPILCVGQTENSSPAAQSMVGLWGAETSFGPLIKGEFTLVRRRDGWRAKVAGLEAEANFANGSVEAQFPAGAGTFRARLQKRNGAFSGYWIQPAGTVNAVKYATPVVLKVVAPNIWSGSVAPLDDSFSLYMAIAKHADGQFTASFRNPDRNDRGGPQEFNVRLDGRKLSFIDPKRPANNFDGSYDEGQQQIVVNWLRLGLPLVLTRRTPDNAVGYFPRVPARDYHYRRPLADDDGWATASASEVGIDENALTVFINDIQRVNVADPSAPLIHSVLIARHGKLVLDEYFFGFDKGKTHDLRSGSKTFASVLVGAAIRQGQHVDINAPVLSYFHDYRSVDERKRGINLKHLMTMSSGLACDDNDNDSPGNENAMQSQTAQPDWYKFILALPMKSGPGEHYAYCSGGVNLIGGVIRSVTGEWLPAYFDNVVAKPLDIRRYHMNLTPTNELYFGGGMRLRPRDYLKFGQMYLDDGQWRGRQIVRPEWVKESTSPQISAGPQSSDGFNWHLYQLRSGGRTFREYEANGNGGQFLIVLPELDLAVVFTAGNYNMYGVWRKFRDELLPNSIIPAIKAKRLSHSRRTS